MSSRKVQKQKPSKSKTGSSAAMKSSSSNSSQPTRSTKSDTLSALYLNPVFRIGITVAETVIIITCASVANLSSQLALHPLYGSTTTSLHFREVVGISCILSLTRPAMPAHRVILLLAVLLAAGPLSAKALGSFTARFGNATWGPIITQLSMAAPITGLTSVLLRGRLAKLLPGVYYGIISLLSAVLLFVGTYLLEGYLWNHINFGGIMTSCNMFLGLSMLASTATGISTPLSASTMQDASRTLITSVTVVSIPMFLTLFVKYQSPCTTPSLPRTVVSTHYPLTNASVFTKMKTHGGWPPQTFASGDEPHSITVNLLARSDSVTGTILVGENVDDGYRFLRADHSLLGGRWIGEKTHGNPMGESIYGAFVLQEAIRLVEREEHEEENALIIGLGIGIAAESLLAHKKKVHIVEIDPAVYTYAREFFGLSEPTSVHLMDARKWVHDRSIDLHSSLILPFGSKDPNIERLTGKYPLVIHDCFSGGSVPSHIFTVEFWNELQSIMTADGVLAVNFAGHLGGSAARAIWVTLQEAFSTENGGKGCRVFHDVMHPSGSEEDGRNDTAPNTFLNMVFFCQKNDGTHGLESKVTFRQPVEADFLRSWLRKMVLSTMEQREVTREEITGVSSDAGLNKEEWLLTDKNNRLGEWQHSAAVEHWSVMRQVMPYNVWEVY